MSVIETNQNDITNETKKEFVKNECENTGNKKVWKRNCPKCSKELTYYSRQNLWRANKNRCICNFCSGINRKGRKVSPEIKEKISKNGTKYHLPNRITLTCLCGNKWNINKRNYIRFYLKPNKQPLCSFCINQEIANNITHKQKQIRSKKMSQIMKGRKITWNDSLVKNHWTKDLTKNNSIREKISNTKSILISQGKIKFNTGFKSGYYKSIKTNNIEYYHSSWELNKMKLLDVSKDVVWWTKNHKIRIPYSYNGVIHHYIPDFLIKKKSKIILEEVKGYIKDIDIFNIKCRVAKRYCKENNMEYKISYDNNIKK